MEGIPMKNGHEQVAGKKLSERLFDLLHDERIVLPIGVAVQLGEMCAEVADLETIVARVYPRSAG
jgi:hypothetical protein